MVQTQPKKRDQNGSELHAKYQAIVQDVDSLPPAMLASLASHIVDVITQQLSRREGEGASNPVAKLQSSVSRNGAEANRENTDFDELLAMSLRQNEMSEQEVRQMKLMAYEAWMALPPSDDPPPTDEEVEQLRHEHRMEKYGR